MQMLQGKKGVIFGVANKRSIAWAIAESLSREGAELAITYQGDRVKENVDSLSKSLSNCTPLPCDVTNDTDVRNIFSSLSKKWGKLDFLIHSVAFAQAEDLQGEYIKTGADGFQQALMVSAYSLTRLTREARGLLEKSEGGGSVITLSYLGGEKAIPNYNVMGVAKAALENSVRYLANDLGPSNIRVNAISAGPLSTLAARGIKGFTDLLKHHREKAPMRRNTEPAEVGDTALFLASHLSRGITGEVVHVDGGFNILGV